MAHGFEVVYIDFHPHRLEFAHIHRRNRCHAPQGFSQGRGSPTVQDTHRLNGTAIDRHGGRYGIIRYLCEPDAHIGNQGILADFIQLFYGKIVFPNHIQFIMQIYHNPRCRKSRETLAFLLENGVEPEIIEYLKSPPTFDELKEIVRKLGIQPQDLIRKQEEEFKTHFKGKNLAADEYIQAMVSYPKLIERPIVISGDQAVIGRPRENVLKLIEQ